MVFVDVLGAFRVVVNGEQAVLRGPMQGAVLARLVAAGGEVVSADRFVEELWEGEPPPKAGAALQAHISHLRRALEPDRPRRAPARVLISQPPGYALARDAATVDAWRFEELLRHADTATDPAIRLRILDTALSLWRGDAYAPYADTAWAAPEIGRITELRWTAMEFRAATALSLNRPAEVAAALFRHVEDHPEREEAVRLLALAQYRQGRQLAALETLRRVRIHLDTEFGIDPSPPLRTLESAILAQSPELDHVPVASPGRSRMAATFSGTGAAAGSASEAGATEPRSAVQPPRTAAPPSGRGGRTVPRAAGPVSSGETPTPSSGVRPGLRGSRARQPAKVGPRNDALLGDGTAETVVGYAVERSGLLAEAEAARVGRSRVVWIDGEAGAGKTTLVGAVTRELETIGWTVTAGHCPEVDGAPAAWAWIELCAGLTGSRKYLDTRTSHAEPGWAAYESGDSATPADPAGIRGDFGGSAEHDDSAGAHRDSSGQTSSVVFEWAAAEFGAPGRPVDRTRTEEFGVVAASPGSGRDNGGSEVTGAPVNSHRDRGGFDAVRSAAGSTLEFDVNITPFDLARRVAERCRMAGGPVAVVLEDAHRADSATLQVLRQVVAWLAEEPVLFVVTLRGSEAGDELQATVAALTGVTASRFELRGLDAEAVRAVIAAAGMPVIDGATLDLVRDRTGGNPMFVRELAKLAAAEGDLLAVPAGVRDVLRRRIARLPADAARMLRFMAVWGDEVAFDDLLELADEDEDTLVDLVDTAVVAGLLRVGRAGRIRFGHALTRDAVYEDIPTLRRGRMHWTALRVATRGRHHDLDALAHHAIAGATGATADQALHHVVAAARQCVARGAHADAVPLWRAAVDLHVLAGHVADHRVAEAGTHGARIRRDTPPAAARSGPAGEVAVLSGEAGMLAGGFAGGAALSPRSSSGSSGSTSRGEGFGEHGIRGHDGVVDITASLDVLEVMCSLTTALGYGGNDSSARAVRLQALDLALAVAATSMPGHTSAVRAAAGSADAGSAETVTLTSDPVAYVLSSWRAPVIWGTRDKRLPDTRIVEALAVTLARPLPAATRVRLLVATVFEVEGNDDPLAFAAAAEALAVARTLDEPELLCAALNARTFLALGPDLWDEREALAAELLAVSTVAGFVEYQAVAHFLRCLIACSASDLVEARAAAERGLECASGGQLRQMLTVLSLFSAVLALLRGDAAGAAAIYAECSAQLVASGTVNGAELMVAGEMMLGWARGDLSHMADAMGAIHAVAPGALVFAYVVALLDAGEIDRARGVFRAAGPVQRDHYWSVMVVFRARAAVRLGEMDAVRECYAEMTPRSGTMAGLDTGSVVYGPMDAVLAELADALGDPVAAARHRESAAAVSAHIRAQLAELEA